MIKKLTNLILGSSVVAGFISLMGAVGGSDLNVLDFNEVIIRLIIGLALIAVGLLGLRLTGCEYIY